jgi:biotin transport system substrate-specific component
MALSKASTLRPLSVAQSGVAAQILWTLLFAALTAASARVEIPHDPVPFTLQTLVVLLSGAFLGPRNGAVSQLVYLSAGVLGAPVFALGNLGVTALFGPTGGYLLAFPAAAAIVGLLVASGRTLARCSVGMFAGLLVIFLSGTLYLWVAYLHDFRAALNAGFLVFSWWDALKLMAAAMIYFEFSKRWPRLPRAGE